MMMLLFSTSAEEKVFQKRLPRGKKWICAAQGLASTYEDCTARMNDVFRHASNQAITPVTFDGEY